MPSILVSAAESHLSCGQQRGFFAWQWKFMVALLCPNNSHIVSRTDSPCRKQQACYQSHIFAYCVTATPPPLFSLPHCTARQKNRKHLGKATDSTHQIQGEFYPLFWWGRRPLNYKLYQKANYYFWMFHYFQRPDKVLEDSMGPKQELDFYLF